ncbi:esterase-like activity of phytase family protein [Janthinobacterium agaricidamnosum]|uniref:Phytase n=1 Tax=Janthinobacterium agaricidamnosum NBRC 102515 = DSM 9628 TaxID=1349767 RepID=W0VAM0_9BURK|nr:esterase-like activity of phytase family protein [Janthinobacterium agaricidamnosum]CDG84403.1 phytase [Janthinobacterium agaricidamnosum NBRC 102515 = DSM 9628]
MKHSIFNGRLIPALLAAGLLSACAVQPPASQASAAQRSIAGLRLIGEQRIALKQEFQGTPVGGLSGIDYDPASGTWIIESDDRSEFSPARFYRARLDYDASAFASVTLTGMHYFKQADGTNYQNVEEYQAHGGEVPDVETIRIDPRDASLWYGSEGDRRLGLNPFVKHADQNGNYLSTLPTPVMFNVSQQETGSRNNLSFEGLSFAPDGDSLWLGMEASLYQDGPVSTPSAGSLTRVTRIARDGKVLAQYAYPLGPIASSPAPGKHAENGVSEILAVNDHQLLAIERAGVEDAQGTYKNHIRIYEMDTDGATDISGIPALQGASFVAMRKRLVLDLETLGLDRLDNIEGISWGPRLANGHDSLVLISDDNFNHKQVTQLLAFEVLPK